MNASAIRPALMDAALVLAGEAARIAPPNPAVGCIIASASGAVLGSGHTQQAGDAHAEVMALREAAEHGHDVRGATVYVTLEPCCHQGRTGPCCEALIDAGVSRVVASLADPNPLVCGRGFERLRAAGIEVEVGPGARESRALNIGFFSRMLRGRPWVRVKVAASLDGRTALPDGASQWITGEAARADGHAWRARAGGLLTGIGTILEDNPRLDVRLAGTPRQPPLVVVDSRLETPLDAHIFIAERPIWICCAARNDAKERALTAKGAVVIHLPGANGKVDLAAMLVELARREVNELHVEAGHKLNGSLVRDGLVDEVLLYIAPRMLGAGRDIASFGPLGSLGEALQLEFGDVTQVGPDLRIVARVTGPQAF